MTQLVLIAIGAILLLLLVLAIFRASVKVGRDQKPSPGAEGTVVTPQRTSGSGDD